MNANYPTATSETLINTTQLPAAKRFCLTPVAKEGIECLVAVLGRQPVVMAATWPTEDLLAVLMDEHAKAG
jgi:hypothetical protein